MAQRLAAAPSRLRFWRWAHRQNGTYRPLAPVDMQISEQTVEVRATIGTVVACWCELGRPRSTVVALAAAGCTRRFTLLIRRRPCLPPCLPPEPGTRGLRPRRPCRPLPGGGAARGHAAALQQPHPRAAPPESVFRVWGAAAPGVRGAPRRAPAGVHPGTAPTSRGRWGATLQHGLQIVAGARFVIRARLSQPSELLLPHACPPVAGRTHIPRRGCCLTCAAWRGCHLA